MKPKSAITRLLSVYFESILIQSTVAFIGLLSIIFYIIETYILTSAWDSRNNLLVAEYVFQFFFFGVFLLDYVMCLIATYDKLHFITSFLGIADFLSLIPVFGLLSVGIHNHITAWIGFLHVFRLESFFNFIQLRRSLCYDYELLEDSPVYSMNEISYQAWRLAIYIIMFIFVGAGVVLAVSLSVENAFTSTLHENTLTWFDCLYFVIVTVTTLGYGDVVPDSLVAQAVTVVIIISGFSLIPVLVASLVRALLDRPGYMGSLSTRYGHARHVVLCGIVDSELVGRFLIEVLHPSHISTTTTCTATASSTTGRMYDKSHKRLKQPPLVVAILSPLEPTEPVKQILRLSQFRERVFYFMGSGKSSLALSRVRLESAVAVYVVGDELTQSLRTEEDSIFLTSLSMIKYLRRFRHRNNNDTCPAQSSSGTSSSITTYPFSSKSSGITTTSNRRGRGQCDIKASTNTNHRLNLPRTLTKLPSTARIRPVLTQAGFNVVLPIQEFKYSLIGFGMVFPGFLALFETLNRSYAHHSAPVWVNKSVGLSGLRGQQQRLAEKLPEYFESAEYSIHQAMMSTIRLKKVMRNLTFKAAVASMYRDTRGTLTLVAIIPSLSLHHPSYRHQPYTTATPSAATATSCIPQQQQQQQRVVLINPSTRTDIHLEDCDSLFIMAASYEDIVNYLENEDRSSSGGSSGGRAAVSVPSTPKKQQQWRRDGTSQSIAAGSGDRRASSSSGIYVQPILSTVSLEITSQLQRSKTSALPKYTSTSTSTSQLLQQTQPLATNKTPSQRQQQQPLITAIRQKEGQQIFDGIPLRRSRSDSIVIETERERDRGKSSASTGTPATITGGLKSSLHRLSSFGEYATGGIPQPIIGSSSSGSSTTAIIPLPPPPVSPHSPSLSPRDPSSPLPTPIQGEAMIYPVAAIPSESLTPVITTRKPTRMIQPSRTADGSRRSSSAKENRDTDPTIGNNLSGSGISLKRFSSFGPITDFYLSHHHTTGGSDTIHLPVSDSSEDVTQLALQGGMTQTSTPQSESLYDKQKGQKQKGVKSDDTKDAKEDKRDTSQREQQKLSSLKSRTRRPTSILTLPPPLQQPQNIVFQHSVLIIATGSHNETVPIHMLFLPLIYILKILRHHSQESLYILTERANEMYDSHFFQDLQQSHAHLLMNTHFINGLPRSPEHLKQCRVDTARVVLIIRPPTVSEAAEESGGVIGSLNQRRAMFSSGSGGTNQVQPFSMSADRHTIITSLNLHLILQQSLSSPITAAGAGIGMNGTTSGYGYNRSGTISSGKTIIPPRSRISAAGFTTAAVPLTALAGSQSLLTGLTGVVRIPTFTVTEIVHEKNIAFLRQPSDVEEDYCDSNADTADDDITANATNTTTTACDFFDFRLLAAGSVLMHSVLDSLMVQAMFNPDILAFWENIVITPIGTSSSISSASGDDTGDDSNGGGTNDEVGNRYRSSSFSSSSPSMSQRLQPTVPTMSGRNIVGDNSAAIGDMSRSVCGVDDDIKQESPIQLLDEEKGYEEDDDVEEVLQSSPSPSLHSHRPTHQRHNSEMKQIDEYEGEGTSQSNSKNKSIIDDEDDDDGEGFFDTSVQLLPELNNNSNNNSSHVYQNDSGSHHHNSSGNNNNYYYDIDYVEHNDSIDHKYSESEKKEDEENNTNNNNTLTASIFDTDTANFDVSLRQRQMRRSGSKCQSSVSPHSSTFIDRSSSSPRTSIIFENDKKSSSSGSSSSKSINNIKMKRHYSDYDKQPPQHMSPSSSSSPATPHCSSSSGGEHHQSSPQSQQQEQSHQVLDKVEVPSRFVGRSYEFLFQNLLSNENVIPIALFRWPTVTSTTTAAAGLGVTSSGSNITHTIPTPMPYVVVSPKCSTILLRNDEIFILSPSSPSPS